MKSLIALLALTLGTSAFAKSLVCNGTDTANKDNWVTFLDVKLPIKVSNDGEFSSNKEVSYKGHNVNVAYANGAIIVQAWTENGVSFLNVGVNYSSSTFRTPEATLEIACKITE